MVIIRNVFATAYFALLPVITLGTFAVQFIAKPTKPDQRGARGFFPDYKAGLTDVQRSPYPTVAFTNGFLGVWIHCA